MFHYSIKLDVIEDLKGCKFRKPRNQPSFDSPVVENNLFSLLIENIMNRFLFGYITRMDNTLKVDSHLLYDVLLQPNRLKEICGESFIKKFSCPECGHLLFRKHLHELGEDNLFEEECPNCSKENIFNYFDLEDDFEIKRIDIIKFLERLVEIGIFSKKLVSYCSSCTISEEISPDNLVSLYCECGNLREIKFEYVSNYDFITDSDGYWFEWYVYMLCRHIYPNVLQNYSCKFKVNDEKYECELDVLTVSRDNKVTIYECKDHMYHLKDKLSMKDFIDNVVKIRHVADKIFVVSSLKNVKANFKDETLDIIDCEIEFIEGMDLEKRFLNEDSIINFFENQNYNIVPLFVKLPDLKKKAILEKIIELIIKNESKDYLGIINDIFNRTRREELRYPDVSLLKKSLETSIENVSDDKFVVGSLKYIENLYYRRPNVFKGIFDLNNFLRIGTRFLTSDPFVGYKMRAPFYYFISYYFKKEPINVLELDNDIVQDFLLKFVPMIKIYYGNSSLVNTLNVFKKLWASKNDEIEDNLVRMLLQEYGASPFKQHLIREFIEEKFDDFSDENKMLITSEIEVH